MAIWLAERVEPVRESAFAPAAGVWAALRSQARTLARDPRVLCLAAWLALAIALTRGSGHYERGALRLTTLGFCLLALAAFMRLRRRPGASDAPLPVFERLLGGALVVVLVAGARLKPGWHVTLEGFQTAHSAALYVLAGLSAAVAFGPASWRRGLGALFVLGCAAAAALHIAMPIASPAPVIDVFVMLQESARNLLAGLNPYTVVVTDVYGGRANYGYDPNFAYAYLPTTLYPQAVSYWLFSDMRYAHVLAEFATAGFLFVLARRRMSMPAAQWIALLYLFHPRGLYVIENAWTEPLLIAAYALCDWLASRHPGSKRLAIAYGVFLSMKLYLVYFALHALLLERRPARLLLIAAAALATALPFILVNPEAFLRYGLLFQLTPGFRPDALSLLAGLYHLGVPIHSSKLPAILAGAACAVFTLWRFLPLANEGWRWATAITTWAIFLMGSQAFCNYYYFVGAMILFTLAGAGERETPQPAAAA